MRRAGLGLLEVMIALIVIVVAALPLIRSGTTIHHRTYTNEFHVLATVRARSILSLATALDFEVLFRKLGAAPSPALSAIDLTQLLDADDLNVLLKAPRRGDTLYEEKTKLMAHRLEGRVLDLDKIELRVLVTWTIPAEKRAFPHEMRLGTILHRPEATTTKAVPLR